MRVLAVNPGSTSTKIAVFDDEALVCGETIRHGAEELAERVADQAGFRLEVVLESLRRGGVPLDSLDAVVGRGGLTRPVAGGTYVVDDALLSELAAATWGEHASNLGAALAHEIARMAADAGGSAEEPQSAPARGGVGPQSALAEAASQRTVRLPAFVVDPVVVDELDDVARFSGHPEIERRSIFHALNSKAAARRWAAEHGRSYADVNLIVAHLGGGISVAAHQAGRVVDVNNALDGDGPLAPERAGGLPSAAWAKLVLTRAYSADDSQRLLVGGGGLASLVGTSDAVAVEQAASSDQETGSDRGSSGAGASSGTSPALALDALAYQVAKEIGSRAAGLRGRVDGIVLTGGLAQSTRITGAITSRVAFIADVTVYPGEDELAALRDGALRVLRGEEPARAFAPSSSPVSDHTSPIGAACRRPGPTFGTPVRLQSLTSSDAPPLVRVIAGHYGSGKTEFAVNLALHLAAQGRRVALADLDIVNPYFRSRERADLLEAAGVKVISSTLGHVSTLEIPAISPEIRGPLTDADTDVIIDLGGDPTGAKVLAQFRADVRRRAHELLVVVNAYRPETSTPDAARALLADIEAAAGLPAAGLISNTHLLRDTTAADVRSGLHLTHALAAATGVGLRYVAAIPDALAALTPAEHAQLAASGVEELPIGMHLREDWM